MVAHRCCLSVFASLAGQETLRTVLRRIRSQSTTKLETPHSNRAATSCNDMQPYVRQIIHNSGTVTPK